MRRSQCSEEYIVGIWKEDEAKAKTTVLCRQHGTSERTLRRVCALVGIGRFAALPPQGTNRGGSAPARRQGWDTQRRS